MICSFLLDSCGCCPLTDRLSRHVTTLSCVGNRLVVSIGALGRYRADVTALTDKFVSDSCSLVIDIIAGFSIGGLSDYSIDYFVSEFERIIRDYKRDCR